MHSRTRQPSVMYLMRVSDEMVESNLRSIPSRFTT